jgi:hypothetical protein
MPAEPDDAPSVSPAPTLRQAIDSERRRRALQTIRRVAPRLGVSLEDLSDEELEDHARRMAGDLDDRPTEGGRDPLDVLAEEFERAEHIMSDRRSAPGRGEGWLGRARPWLRRRPAP